MNHLFELSNTSKSAIYRSRSLSPENFTGSKGEGGKATDGVMSKEAAALGHGWKLSPCVRIAPGETFELGNVNGSGRIRHIWMTGYNVIWRLGIVRFYWDESQVPSIECPLGDSFAAAEVDKIPVFSSLAVCLNPKNAVNCYWDMPYRKSFRITLENRSEKTMTIFYQIDYLEGPVEPEAGYFHAQFRRERCVPYKVPYTVADGIRGQGTYVGTYMYWTVQGNDWWGEGEMKFYVDGDTEYPTICGTGTEDYFCGGDGFLTHDNRQYVPYSTAYAGFLNTNPDSCLHPRQSFSMYRWHITDPIYFREDLRITVQDLGWKNEDRSLGYQARRDDISSVAFWYQDKPQTECPPLPPDHELEIL